MKQLGISLSRLDATAREPNQKQKIQNHASNTMFPDPSLPMGPKTYLYLPSLSTGGEHITPGIPPFSLLQSTHHRLD